MGERKGRDLSPRQRACVDADLQRLTAKEIGRQLEISPHTVAMHLRLARAKAKAEDKPHWSETVDQTGDGDQSCFVIMCGAALGGLGFLSCLWVLGMLTLKFSPWFAHLRH